MAKIVRKHENSRHCFICGLENKIGLKTEFFETEDGELAAVFTPTADHQSYPGVVHGGISAAVLDELIGRAINIKNPDMFAMTVELSMQYKKPVPYGKPLIGKAHITNDGTRIYEGEGIIYNENGEVCVIATGKYFKMPAERIAKDFDMEKDWFVNAKPDDPTEI